MRANAVHFDFAKVYDHHCIGGLPTSARALRDAAVYGLRQREALAWALELLGFTDVCVKVRRRWRRQQACFLALCLSMKPFCLQNPAHCTTPAPEHPNAGDPELPSCPHAVHCPGCAGAGGAAAAVGGRGGRRGGR